MTKSELNSTRVSKVMSNKVITAGALETIATLNLKLKENNIHHIPIVDESNELLGMVTSSDIFILQDHSTKIGHESSLRKNEKILRSSLARDVMSTGLRTVQSTETIEKCIELLANNRFHAIPVLEGNHLVGIITTFDLVMYAYR